MGGHRVAEVLTQLLDNCYFGAYPAAAYGTVLPFRRVFVVAHKA